MVGVSWFILVIEGMILKSRMDKEPKRSLVIGIWSDWGWTDGETNDVIINII